MEHNVMHNHEFYNQFTSKRYVNTFILGFALNSITKWDTQENWYVYRPRIIRERCVFLSLKLVIIQNFKLLCKFSVIDLLAFFRRSVCLLWAWLKSQGGRMCQLHVNVILLEIRLYFLSLPVCQALLRSKKSGNQEFFLSKIRRLSGIF